MYLQRKVICVGMTVYADLFFLINFSMDFLCLFLTAKLMSERIRLGRYLLAAALGGIYACLALFSTVGRAWSLFIDISVCLIMSLVAFLQRKRTRQIPLLALVFTAVSIVLGGFMTALFNLFNQLGVDELFSGENAEDSISVWLLLILALLGGAFTRLFGGFFRKRGLRKFADIEISFDGKTARVRAMADSGNLLKDPVSNIPCIVADTQSLRSVFPKEIFSAIEPASLSGVGSISEKYASRIRFIPTKTAMGEGILLGVRADKIKVDVGGQVKEVDAVIVPRDIGKTAEGSEALLPSELLI